MRFLVKTAGAALLLVVLFAAVVVTFFDWDAMRPEIERRVSAGLQRDVRIAGPLEVRLGWRPHVVARQVSVVNAPWGRAPNLLEAERAHATLRLLPLLRGRLEIVEAGIDGGKVALERSAAGEENWDFVPQREPDEAPPGFERLAITRVAVSFADHAREAAIGGSIEHLALATGDDGPLAIAGSGVLQERPWALELDLAYQRNARQSLPVSGTLRLGNQTLSVHGRDGEPLELEAAGADLHADLAPFGIDIGRLPPYEASAVVEIQQDGQYRLHDLHARLGASEVRAQGSFAPAPPALEANVHVARLHLPDLDGLDTAADDAGFLEQPLPLELLRRARAAVSLRLDAITDERGRIEPFHGVQGELRLQDGVLRVLPFEAAWGEGRVQGEATLDARAEVPAVAASIAFDGHTLRLEGSTGARGIPAEGRYKVAAEGSYGNEGYAARAQVGIEPQGVRLQQLSARLGASELRGGALVSADPLAVRADLVVPRLHVPDFAAGGERDGGGSLEAALPVELLRRADAALDLRVERITGAPDWMPEGLRLAAELQDGVLRVSPLRSALGNQALRVYATLDATVDRPTLDVLARLGGSRLELSARSGPGGALAGARFDVTAQGSDALPPFEASAAVALEDGVVRIAGLDARLGESQLRGGAELSLEPLALQARIRVPRLHLPDLEALRGDQPDDDAGWLERPLPVALMRRARADVEVHVERVTSGELLGAVLEAGRLEATLRDGVLRVSPLAADVSRGTLKAYATLDATVQSPTVDTLFSLSNLRLERVADEIEAEQLVEHISGGLGGSAELSAAGRSPREMIERLNGTVGFALAGGSMSYVADRLAALDLAGVAKWLAGDDEPIELECMISLFEVENGVARPRVMLLASEDTDIWGEGEVNLREGTVELELEAKPRGSRLGVLRSPIRIEGELASPSVAPAAGPLAARAAAGIVLGALAAPIAALLGTLTTGPGDETVCDEYASAVRRLEQGEFPDAPIKRGSSE